MSETTIDPGQTVDDAPAPPAADEQQHVEPAAETAPDLAAEVAKWKALSKKNEQRAKENAEARKRLDEIEEASKTETERFRERAEAAEKEAKQARADAMRAKKAATSGVDEDLIHGDTEEEMDAAIEKAKKWAESLAKPPIAPPANIVTSDGKAPKGDQIRSRDELKSMTPQQVLAAEQAGRLDELMGKST